ncbi:EutN/CcmL family microcompartment protein [Helicovermis profundi]|uniref:EutN/CcmL family microcompartment protein n=1 Tax=Helicovermis profundi TaxID=3065157 RepID=A0AAU9ENC9_9FIRM|nr:EutN/CcmL family microcompartment protein [Clostridia bacterium S502]
MKTGVIIGTIVATRKDDSMVGHKLLATQQVDLNMKPIGQVLIAVDAVGAGVGDYVLFSTGSAARNSVQKPKSSIDAAIVGIIDGKDIHFDVLDEIGGDK